MSITAFEGVVIDGQIQLTDTVSLPNYTKVYVIVPDSISPPVPHIVSPRLANPVELADFRKEVIEEQTDAGV